MAFDDDLDRDLDLGESSEPVLGDDVSEFDGEPIAEFDDDEPRDQFRSDAEADADVLRSAGWGTDEDYGGCGDGFYDE